MSGRVSDKVAELAAEFIQGGEFTRAAECLIDYADTDVRNRRTRQVLDEAIAREFEKVERETVAVPREAVETAAQELGILIAETGGSEGWRLEQGAPQSMTPLALALYKVEQEGHDEAAETIREVGRQTGAETSPVDPLTDRIFNARDELTEALERPQKSDRPAGEVA